MFINRPIHLATTKEESRYVLNDVMLEGDTLIATDGHIIAAVPAEKHETDIDGLIPYTAVEGAFKSKMKRLDANGDAKFCHDKLGVISVPRNTDKRFPTWTMVRDCSTRGSELRITFDAALLYRLAQAINIKGKTSITMHLPHNVAAAGDGNPLYVTPCDGVEAWGALMPCTEGTDPDPLSSFAGSLRTTEERLRGALQWLVDDLGDAGEDKNPETGEYYASVINARCALEGVPTPEPPDPSEVTPIVTEVTQEEKRALLEPVLGSDGQPEPISGE